MNEPPRPYTLKFELAASTESWPSAASRDVQIGEVTELLRWSTAWEGHDGFGWTIWSADWGGEESFAIHWDAMVGDDAWEITTLITVVWDGAAQRGVHIQHNQRDSAYYGGQDPDNSG